MDNLKNDYQTVKVRVEEDICFAQIYRPDAANAINATLIAELDTLLRQCAGVVKVFVLEGLPEVFCSGADFHEIKDNLRDPRSEREQAPGPLYDLWRRFTVSPFITVAHVRGRVNAGGVGFVAACDIVLSESRATFSLSELLFSLMPACVLPFLIRRIGFARANYLTLSTQPVTATLAREWGLVDLCEDDSANLLRKQLLRLRRLERDAVVRYKRYAGSLDGQIDRVRESALAANVEVFSDARNVRNIARYVEKGKFPWEQD